MSSREARRSEIAAMIASDTSPVGIDAKKTHVLIIEMLEDIQRRLERLERAMDEE